MRPLQLLTGVISLRRLLVCAALAFTASVAFAPASSASSKTVNLAGTRYDDDGWVNWWPQSCSVSGVCTFKGDGIVQWSGAFTGISQYTVYLSYNPSTNLITDSTWERFTGNLAGCGYGSFLTHQTKSFTWDDVVRYQDPTTGKLQAGSGTWNYVRGTATGNLARLATFTLTVKKIEFEPGTFENHGKIDRGTAVCRRT